MNMRVASDSVVAEAPLVTARLPGEPEEAEASEPAEPEAQQPPRRARRVNRKVLLAGVAVGALVAGVGFLISPYNHVVPMPARVRAAASLVWNRQPLLAPSAELAQVTLPPPSGPAVRTPYVGQPPSQQVNEVVALRAGAPASTQSSGQPAEVSSPPAPPSPPAARPATPPTPAPAPSGAAAAGIDEPPPGFGPHEPGSGLAGEASVPPGANPPPTAIGTAPGAASAPPRAPDTSATVPPTASSDAAAASDGGDGASAPAAPSPASPAPTAVPPSVSTGDITQQIMTQVTASLELKPPSFAAPALPDSAPAGNQAAV